MPSMNSTVEVSQQERLANLALVWPQHRWRPVISTLLEAAGSLSDREVPTLTEARAEFLDGLAASEVGALSGWLKVEDLPVGFVDLALRVLDHEESEEEPVSGPLLLCALARARTQSNFLHAGGVVPAAPAFASGEEAHLHAFDQMLDSVRCTLFDVETRRAFSLMETSEPSPRQFTIEFLGTHDAGNSISFGAAQTPLSAPSAAMLTGLWRFAKLAGKLQGQSFGLSEGDRLLASAYWHLLLRWTRIARRRQDLMDTMLQALTEFLRRQPQYPRLHITPDLAAVDEFRTGLAAISDNRRGGDTAIDDYARRVLGPAAIGAIRNRKWARPEY